MPTKDDLDDVLQRVAITALAFYPTIADDEPGWVLADDVTWCLQPLPELDPLFRDRLEVIIGATITDPTANRQNLFGVLFELVPDTP